MSDSVVRLGDPERRCARSLMYIMKSFINEKFLPQDYDDQTLSRSLVAAAGRICCFHLFFVLY